MEAALAAGSVIQGIAGYETGKYNRDLANSMALEEERAGAAREAEIREAARMAIGDQIAGQGGSGFQMGSGAALDALALSQVNAALDALTARREAAGRARARRVEGAQAYARGSNEMVQGLIGAGTKVADWASARSAATAGRTPSGGRR